MNHITPSQDYLRPKKLAEVFLKKTKEMDSHEKILEAFENLDMGVQKLVLAEVSQPWKTELLNFCPIRNFKIFMKK